MKLSALVALLLLSGSTLAAPGGTSKPKGKRINFEDAFAGEFAATTSSFDWISAQEDGTYVIQDAVTNNLLFNNIVTGDSRVFVDASKLTSNGSAIDYHAFEIQPNQRHVLFSADFTKQYRHSFFANYYVFDVESQTTIPLIQDQAGVWETPSPLRANNLFVWQNGTITQITTDGSPDIFNGVPDWVYEEEIFSSYFTTWFSPDGEYLAFLRFNETGMPTYRIPYYMAGMDYAPAYPKELELRYPKVGATNPTVSLHLLALSNVSTSAISTNVPLDTFETQDLIVTELAWLTDGHSHVIARTMNRVQDQEKLLLVDVTATTTSVVRERDGNPGWLDSNLAIQSVTYKNASYYVDLSDESGWQHIYLFERAGSKGKALTSGEWEVVEILKVDPARELVYFTSTEQDSTERHIYSVGFDGTRKTSLVSSNTGYYSASFSANATYYLLTYGGPGIPWQNLYAVNDTQTAMQVINNNTALAAKLSPYDLPTISWSTIPHPSGYSFNLMERLPANFDSRKKYPVLFDIYGGPASQQTSKAYKSTHYRTYLGSDPELEFIVVSVDNRGTGFKGRAFRSIVTEQLGSVEAEDQVYAARWYAKNRKFVDKDKVTIWGWSYGGYLTAKVLELDSGAFSFGIITAPVSDWRFYDSMYTERYMKTLIGNAAGYNKSAIVNTAGFNHIAGGFLIQHGTGDDNVHFQNSAVLVDTLMSAGVSPEKMRAQWFTDSDHSILFHGSSAFQYKQITDALYEEKIRGRPESPHQWD